MRALMILLVACGSSTTAPVATTGGPPAAFVAVPAAGDVQVATVEGRPVWGACVADQIARFPTLTKEAALSQCIDLELLAKAAEDKHLAVDREVVDTTRTSLVRRLIDEFEAKYPSSDSMRAQIDEMFAKAGTTTRPEVRASFNAVVPVAAKAPEADHVAGRKAAEQIHQKLAGRTGLFPADLRDAVAGVTFPNIQVGDVAAMPKDNTRSAPEFVGALFAIDEVGRVSPVIKSQFGYHVILLTEIRPAAAIDREQVFAGLRRQLFLKYVADLIKTTTTEVHAELLAPPEEVTP